MTNEQERYYRGIHEQLRSPTWSPPALDIEAPTKIWIWLWKPLGLGRPGVLWFMESQRVSQTWLSYSTELNWGLHPEEPEGLGTWDSTLEGFKHKVPPSQSQCTGSSLKTMWVIQEAESLLNSGCVLEGQDLVEHSLGKKALAATFFFFFPNIRLLPPSCPGIRQCLFGHSLSTLLTPGIPLRNRPTYFAHPS